MVPATTPASVVVAVVAATSVVVAMVAATAATSVVVAVMPTTAATSIVVAVVPTTAATRIVVAMMPTTAATTSIMVAVMTQSAVTGTLFRFRYHKTISPARTTISFWVIIFLTKREFHTISWLARRAKFIRIRLAVFTVIVSPIGNIDTCPFLYIALGNAKTSNGQKMYERHPHIGNRRHYMDLSMKL